MPIKTDARTAINPEKLEHMHAASLRLLSLLATPQVESSLLKQGLESLTALIGVRYGAIGLLDENGKLEQFIHSGVSPEIAARIGRLPEGRGLLDVVIHENHSLRIDDMARDPRAVGLPPNHPPMKNLLAAPVSHAGRSYGRVYLSEKIDGSQFTAEDEQLITRFAEALALTLRFHRTEAERLHVDKARQHAERALRASEEDLLALAENANNGILVNSHGQHVFANQHLADMLGYTLEELRQTGIKDLVHPDEYTNVAERFRARMAGEAVPSQYETLFVTKDGVAIPVEVNATRTVWQGQPAGLAFIRDIREHKKAEIEMLKLVSAVGQTADAIVITDADGFIEYVNPAFEMHTGYRREEAIGRTPSIVKSGQHSKAFYRELWGTLRRGEVFRAVFVNRRKDGTLFHEEKTITPLRDDTGKITHFVSAGRDITERMRAEKETRNIQQFLDSVVENLPVMLFVKEAKNLAFVRFNKAAEELLGYPREELIGKNDHDFFPKDEADFFATKDREVLDSGKLSDIPEEPVHTKTKGVRILHTKKIPILDTAGQPLYLLGISEDITEHKQVEDRLRESEASLREAQRMAQLGNWALDLIGNVLTWSQEIYRIFEIDPEEFDASYEAFLNVIHPGDRDMVNQAYTESVKNKTVYDIEHRLLMPDGRIKYVHERCKTLYDDSGTPLRSIGTVQDITERKRTEEQLSYLAHYDTLTGLPNRARLLERLQQAILDAGRVNRLVAVMFLDLDRFKVINDTLGHHIGDGLLKGVAERLKACVRPGDIVSRLGGDEFTVVLASVAHVDDVARVARKIIDSFAEPLRVEGRDLYTTPSIGITIYPFDESSADGLLKNADAAMYHAKEGSGNTFQFFTADLNTRAERRLRIENALRTALDNNELSLHYQPQVDTKTGRIIGMEALARWQHPDLGSVSPVEFIPIAEETGLILSIGEWVLRAACRQVKTWHATKFSFSKMQMAVNVSSKQLRQKAFPDLVRQVLEDTGLEARYLDLELTESLLMEDVETTADAMHMLHDMGVSFSVDDFGTGYSSLAYLKRFPIDILKIDRTFVRDIASDANDVAIVKTIIAMAHTLGMRVVAEGVETHEQLEFLRSQNCDSSQGYYCSMPLPAEEFSSLLEEWGRIRQGKCRTPIRVRKRTKKKAS